MRKIKVSLIFGRIVEVEKTLEQKSLMEIPTTSQYFWYKKGLIPSSPGDFYGLKEKTASMTSWSIRGLNNRSASSGGTTRKRARE